MPVNESFVGRSYPPTPPYYVSREKIREFADAINDPNPAYRSVEAAKALGYPDVIAPLVIDSVRTAAGNELVGTRSEVRTTAQELVSTAYSIMVVRGAGT